MDHIKKEIRNKLLLNPVDWITLAPMLIGVTLGLGAWAIKLESGMAVAASIILMLVSAGIYLNRLVFGWDDNYERLVNEWREKIENERDRELDRLYKNLREDGDPRTEMLLKDLRTLTKALISEQNESVSINAFDIVSSVDLLFKRSVDYLKESLELWETAEKMERESIKIRLLDQRDALISEVEKSLENLGEVLGSMKKAGIRSCDGQQLDELRSELTSRLRIAEEVEGRMNAMRQINISKEDEQKYLQNAE